MHCRLKTMEMEVSTAPDCHRAVFAALLTGVTLPLPYFFYPPPIKPSDILILFLPSSTEVDKIQRKVHVTIYASISKFHRRQDIQPVLRVKCK